MTIVTYLQTLIIINALQFSWTMSAKLKDIVTEDCFASVLQSWVALSKHCLAKAETEDDELDLLKTFSAQEHWVLFESFRIFHNAHHTSAGTRDNSSDDLTVPQNEPRLNSKNKYRIGSSEMVKSYRNESSLITEGYPLMIDFNEDMSLWMFGKPAGSLPEKLAKPASAFFLLVTIPADVVGGFFAGAMWADILYAVGYGLLIPYFILLFMSLQQQLAGLILKKANTHYIFLATILYVGSIAHRDYYAYEAFSFACYVPGYILAVLCFFCMAMADASPERVRSIILCYCNPGACTLVLYAVLWMRLPGAEKSQGYRTLWVLGVETMSNMDMTGKFGLVLLLLLARGSWSAWRHPKRLAFYRVPISMAVS